MCKIRSAPSLPCFPPCGPSWDCRGRFVKPRQLMVHAFNVAISLEFLSCHAPALVQRTKVDAPGSLPEDGFLKPHGMLLPLSSLKSSTLRMETAHSE